MLSLKKIRKIDPSLEHLSDVELEGVRDALYEFAKLGFEVHRSQVNSSKNPLGFFTDNADKSSI